MNPWFLLGWVWAGAAVMMAGVWWYCHRKRDATAVDIAWSIGIGLAAITGAVLLDGEPVRRWAVALFAVAWSARLASHMIRRSIHKGDEDNRYKTMRQWLGDKQAIGFFVFFQVQAGFVVLFAGPIIAAMAYDGPLSWRDVLGLCIGIGAIVGETIADKQLAKFIDDKKNGRTDAVVCKRGLWRYSRHPNYFFEWLHWFAYLAIGATFATSIGYFAMAGPVVMGVFLIFITGIPYAEKSSLKSKGDAYRQYQKETSPFVPWFPKSASG